MPATGKMLSQQLAELQSSGLLIKTIPTESLPHITYALSERALALVPILLQLNEWGRVEWLEKDNQAPGTHTTCAGL